MDQATEFSLERLERYTYTRRHEDAARQVINLVAALDRNYGQLGRIGLAPSTDFPADLRDAHLATRIASALTALFSDPNFKLSPLGLKQLMLFQRWIATLFGASPFGNADHIIRVFNVNAESNAGQITMSDADFQKFCLLYSLDSSIPLQPDVMWAKDKQLTASLFVALLSSRLVATPEAHVKREQLLEWFPPRVQELSLKDIPEEILHNVWMHCSYAARPDKHAIKRAINGLIRDQLLALGFKDLPGGEPPRREKPVIMCITEWFTGNHSIYRTHSVSMEALKSSYHLVGVSLGEASDETTRAVFDEAHIIPRAVGLAEKIKQVTDLVASVSPDMVYYPSVGMFQETMFLVNLRLAPIQMVALGHPATTHSPYVDYIMVEEDYVGDPDCFSETLVALPKEAIPYRPPTNCPDIAPVVREAPDLVRIAVGAAVMKLNPVFLNALRRIAQESKVPVEFHFFTGFGRGIGKVYVQNLVRRFLPDCAVIYPELVYDAYLEKLNSCDMFVNPFPFGNTNGIVDTVRQGLPGICLSGAEVHSHIDEGLFNRLNLPDWMVARNIDDYVTAAVRLAEDHELRARLSREIQKTDPDKVLFQGNPKYFVEAVNWLRATHAERAGKEPEKMLRPPWPQPQRPTRKTTAAPAKPARERSGRKGSARSER